MDSLSISSTFSSATVTWNDPADTDLSYIELTIDGQTETVNAGVESYTINKWVPSPMSVSAVAVNTSGYRSSSVSAQLDFTTVKISSTNSDTDFTSATIDGTETDWYSISVDSVKQVTMGF
ncbi:MAG: hypothetical protein ACLFR1_02775 [Spirochaetia bacterium]